MLLIPLFLAVVMGNTPQSTAPADVPRQELHVLQQDSQDSLSPYNTLPSLPGPLRELRQTPNFLLNEKSLLASQGADFFVSYTANIAGNPIGGSTPNGFTYADFLYLGCVLDTDKIFGWPHGSLTISAAQVDGNDLSAQYIGNEFPVQEIFVGQTFYFYQFFYKQQFLNDNVVFKIGRMSSGSDFATSPLYWLYMNGGIDGSPQALLMGEGISYYPVATWGSCLKLQLTPSTALRLGVYQVTPGSLNGLNWNFYANDGVLMMAQYNWDPIFSSTESAATKEPSPMEVEKAETSKNPISSGAKNFQGHYWMGGYCSTSTFNESLGTSQPPGSFGLYWHADQTVYRPNPLNNTGLVLWSVITLSPQNSIAFMPFQVNGGAVYTGLIPGRKNDNTIFGIAYGNFSPNFAASQQQSGGGYPTYELVYEAGYRLNFTSNIYIQPDLQLIVNPGGIGTIPNAFVIGAQIGASF